ncbi:MAG: hypothetical protein IPL22_11010 [Bacteroidetes bacterium]|nr:hypothetical protein [Bacteroidota bacterium]
MNVAIIGSGLTGTLAAIYLKKSNADTNVILFEKSADKTLRGFPILLEPAIDLHQKHCNSPWSGG